jgi:hypothetical protein
LVPDPDPTNPLDEKLLVCQVYVAPGIGFVTVKLIVLPLQTGETAVVVNCRALEGEINSTLSEKEVAQEFEMEYL